MIKVDERQIVKYGNSYIPYRDARKLNALNVLKRKSKHSKDFKFEEFSVDQYNQKRNLYKSLNFQEKQQALYLLYKSSEMVYIGQTVRHNIYERPMEHLNCERKPKDYDFVKIMTVPKEICIDTLETDFILSFKPKYNDTWKGIPINRKQFKRIKKAHAILNK